MLEQDESKGVISNFVATFKKLYFREVASRPELINKWGKIKQDERKHLDMIKEALIQDVRNGLTG